MSPYSNFFTSLRLCQMDVMPEDQCMPEEMLYTHVKHFHSLDFATSGKNISEVKSVSSSSYCDG